MLVSSPLFHWYRTFWKNIPCTNTDFSDFGTMVETTEIVTAKLKTAAHGILSDPASGLFSALGDGI